MQNEISRCCWKLLIFAKSPFTMWKVSYLVMFTVLQRKHMNHAVSHKIYYQYIHHDHYERVTFVFDSRVSGLCDMFNLKWSFDQPSLTMDRMGSWEIKESCVLTVVFHDVGLCLSSVELLLYTVTLRHKVRGVNEKLSGQCSRPKIRFLGGRERPSRARSPFTYEMFVWKQFSLYITSHRKVSAD